MREINPKDITLIQRSFGLALTIVLLFSFTKVILKLLFPVLVLTAIIFIISKLIYKNDSSRF